MSGSPTMSTTYSLAIPSKTSHLKDVRQFIVDRGRKAKFSEEVIEAMQTAVDEACANIIEHAYRDCSDEIVNIEVIVKPDCFEVCLRDQGTPFNRSAYRAPDVVKLTKSGASGGLGVRIILDLMDQVEYSNEGQTNIIRLKKFCQRQADDPQ